VTPAVNKLDKRSPPSFHPSFYGPKYWPTWIGLGGLYLLARIPLRLSIKLGEQLGNALYYLAPSRRRIAQTNVALCFPELSAAEQTHMVRGILRSVTVGALESAKALWGPDSAFSKHYTITGLEHITAARERGQGVLLVGCHLTTLDAAGRLLARHVRYDALYRKDPNPLLAYKLIKAREHFMGSAIVRSDTRQLVRNLRNGHVVWYAPDQDYGLKHSVFVPFFGVTAATVVGTGRIAHLGKAAVLPFAHYRDGQGHYHLVIAPPLENFPVGDDSADATRINQVIETAIRQQPEQYLWVHRRFKTRPPGSAPLYAPKKEASQHKWR
jgi:KDO2-lipid IV(A) lauroyltransferase